VIFDVKRHNLTGDATALATWVITSNHTFSEDKFSPIWYNNIGESDLEFNFQASYTELGTA